MVTHLRPDRFERVDISLEWNIPWTYLKEDDLYRAKVHVVIVVRMRKDCRHIADRNMVWAFGDYMIISLDCPGSAVS
jgi:hypothetical protein